MQTNIGKRTKKWDEKEITGNDLTVSNNVHELCISFISLYTFYTDAHTGDIWTL